MRKVGIVMGSDSDLPVIEKAVKILRELDVPFEAHVYSAHRTPEEARSFALNARENGFGVILAAAGMAAHLAGAIAANTTLPVIGIPCRGPALDGMDALLSTVQMPSGIPVATVGVGSGANAALLAAEILAVEDETLAARLADKRRADTRAVLEKDAGIEDAVLAGAVVLELEQIVAVVKGVNILGLSCVNEFLFHGSCLLYLNLGLTICNFLQPASQLVIANQ